MQRMIKFFKSSIKNQIILFLMILSIMISFFILGMTNNYVKNNYYALAEENYLYRVDFEKDFLDNYIEEREKMLEALSAQVEWGIAKLYETNLSLEEWKDDTHVIDALKFFRDNNDDSFEQAFMILPNLDMYTYSNYYDFDLPIKATQNQFDIVSERNQPGMSNPRISKFSGKPITVIADVLHHKEETMGIIGATIYLEKLDEFFNKKADDLYGETFVVYDGQYLSHPDSSLILKEGVIFDYDFPNSRGFFTKNIQGNSDLNYFYSESTKIEGAYVVSVVDSKTLYQQVEHYLAIMLVLLLISLIIVIGVTYLIANRLTRPVIYLKETMDQATRGDFSVRANVQSEDELGQAMKSFNYLMNRITELTFFDKLTGLPNYRQFKFWFNKDYTAIKNSNLSGNNGFSLVMLSVNGFKSVNETYGITAGDMIISEIAKRLRVIEKNTDKLTYISRFSGDEFLLFFQNISDPQELDGIVSDITKTMSMPYVYHEHQIFLRFVAGAAYCDSCYLDLDFQLSVASSARSIAKTEKKDYFIAGSQDELIEEIKARKDLENDLHLALEKGFFEVYYQPIYLAAEDRFIGLEALLRYNHPLKGQISPMDFIPIAEEIGIIDEIGRFVLEESAKLSHKLAHNGFDHFEMHVNISPEHFNDPGFVGDIKRVIEKYTLEKGTLNLEITEEVALINLKEQEKKFKEIQKIGVAISIDDFGTGYSSFLYLNRLSVNQIKIDKSFVLNMVMNKKDYEIVKTINSLAEALEIDLIAEGVETRELHDILMIAGVKKMQGYYFAMPMPEEKLFTFLEEKRG